ncbi:aspartate aminotransferase family protein [Actinomadura chibensis]|uniref:Aminotransferase class III-fold pyridoxal phosphate-dependent enzyme n=1 Tax=Actinomadura chibensis TaxID=392828 RepID=A0A5D0NPA7_9ACTN|nr:aminotransferase class III-fold pyridoxal phosphate-dependent enzyme [Actinomadura chibensis]TYB46400.1 aminotransferase class III-fold pyridoxal phosphate-dependent enzyme [Actinomadura chibensis]
MTTTLATARAADLGSGRPVVDRAEGCWIYDTEGRDYLDASSGTVCVNIGHGVPEVLAAMADQARRVCFAHRNQFVNRPAVQLTEAVHEVTGHLFREVVYTNSGSEATEAALRLLLNHHALRGAADRTVVLAQFPSYHGMTAGALSISGHPPRQRNLTALHASPVSVGAVRARARDALVPDPADWEAAFAEVGSDRIAAVVVEPVGCAASGAAVIPDETLRGLRELCDRTGALLVVDEVMTGFGRTGDWFAHSRSGARPDLVITGKGLGAGYAPIGACLVGRAVLPGRSASDVAVGHTMSGNPLSAATALAVLRYVREHGLLDRARRTGELLAAGLAELAADWEFVGEPRGRGLIQGLPLVQDPAAFADGPLNLRLCEAAMRCGLQLYPAGVDARFQSVLVSPPLTLTEGELDTLLARLDRAVRLVADELGATRIGTARRSPR